MGGCWEGNGLSQTWVEVVKSCGNGRLGVSEVGDGPSQAWVEVARAMQELQQVGYSHNKEVPLVAGQKSSA